MAVHAGDILEDDRVLSGDGVNIGKPVHVFQLAVGGKTEPLQPLPVLPEEPPMGGRPDQDFGAVD